MPVGEDFGKLIMDSRLIMGTLEMLMLDVISRGPSYGYEIAQTVGERSSGVFEMKEGSLYPALHRLEQQQYVSSYWQEIEGRRRKYYRISASGKKALEAKKAEWKQFSQGVQGVLGLNLGARSQVIRRMETGR